MILAAYGVTLLGVALIPALRTRAMLKSGARAEGTVVGTKEGRTSRGTRYYPVVRFTTADGRMVEFTSASATQAMTRTPARSLSAIVPMILRRPRLTAPPRGCYRPGLGWLAGWRCWWLR
jgi:hypothetical protein